MAVILSDVIELESEMFVDLPNGPQIKAIANPGVSDRVVKNFVGHEPVYFKRADL